MVLQIANSPLDVYACPNRNKKNIKPINLTYINELMTRLNHFLNNILGYLPLR